MEEGVLFVTCVVSKDGWIDTKILTLPILMVQFSEAILILKNC